MPYEKAPSSGAFLPLSLMYFLSGEPMHCYSGVDRVTRELGRVEPGPLGVLLDDVGEGAICES